MTEMDCFMPIGIAFVISAISGSILIPLLRRLKAGQVVREDGPDTHLKKNGTPTMGGILILLSVTVTALLYIRDYPRLVPVLFSMLGFGMIGFLDDFLKVILKRSMGLAPWQKMALQLIVTGIFAWYMTQISSVSLAMKIPFMKGYSLDFGWLTLPLLFVAVIGTVNGTNFTDGLDGLASSVTVMVATFFTAAAIGTGVEIAPVCGAVTGALLGFLLFNVYPAAVFMGDTGSLALGGFVAACAYIMQIPLFLPMVGLIYMAEVLSVIVQVSYYKISGGRRILKMAPLHHHFELCGWKETQVVFVFTLVTALLCIIALFGIS